MFNAQVWQGILIPFAGTVLGSAFVFFMKGKMKPSLRRSMSAFAAGVMVAASIWSLLIPAMEESEHLGSLAFLPAAVGFWIGILLLLLMDMTIPHIHPENNVREGRKTKKKFSDTLMLMFAVTLHNFPEGMSVGVVYAGMMMNEPSLSAAGALGLAIGISLQNVPEGAIISMPLRSHGYSKTKAFIYGSLSGIVEPIGAILTILMGKYIVPILPYMLGFAAGAMMYVVVEELLPDAASGEHSNTGTLIFALGFTLMMALDVVFG
ncbi:ZIP family metal transporter [Ileibacterium valens]|uniref:ZIP zinc transporter n=1 Tax=Ileibacterium valens TaxID=1862668 RepID=A0A1U7NJ74_9FIRM|nr:ZIP family metal transporter [Ileibacterium valens]OLU38089.1 ZIP zinc transporter [Erysipelotrichaceae bacterium NYU-BL-E8]OLU42237.1 ZIP zinc transporter [Erysipelotrichaceae bacterium NYU-BL-F16]OLU43133.1 ZIP zinc transporter [Ileibacterium valens]